MPDADLHVYAVWFSMVASDSQQRWPDKLLTDPRVRHFWDEQKLVGRWYGEQVTAKSAGHVEWDAYFLYDAQSVWGEEGPTRPVSWGRTIVDSRQQLRDDLLRQVRGEE